VGANPYDSNPKAWIVIIAHSVGLRTWYAHIDNYTYPPAVSLGQVVRAGQVIAYEGMTGRTTGPHLHWMVELEGDFVNPRMFL
jgi:murein DD-endopeptidase MepM/ murein hydrolase activator NlpD